MEPDHGRSADRLVTFTDAVVLVLTGRVSRLVQRRRERRLNIR